MRILKWLVLAAVAFVGITAVLRGGKFFLELYAHAKFDENGGQVRSLANVIQLEQPANASRESLLKALRHDGIKNPESHLYDAWHRPLVVKIWRDAAREYHYQVISLGRDGRAGPCSISQPHCYHHPDADWILRDNEFVQTAAP